jgi:hypothetical protein
MKVVESYGRYKQNRFKETIYRLGFSPIIGTDNMFIRTNQGTMGDYTYGKGGIAKGKRRIACDVCAAR